MNRARRSTIAAAALLLALVGCAAAPAPAPPPASAPRELPSGQYPWHTDIIATTFWVGELFDPNASDGSQMISTYDSRWYESYGGCDGLLINGPNETSTCQTERRSADDDYFPTQITPLQNPFYLDLPFDDVHNDAAFAMRGDVVPWASDPEYASIVDDRTESLMKNRWVVLHRDGRYCYAQIQDAGPALYDDARYVFGDADERPTNTRFNGAGLDVSPAVNGCLAFDALNGTNDRVDWAFVDAEEVPDGPWTVTITTSGVQ